MKSMSENFLPTFRPRVTAGTLQCEVRGKAVKAKPEERIRQRVLRWLLRDKKWPRDSIRVERSHPWVGDVKRSRVRSDIELLKDGKVQVVVECKRPDVPLSQKVDQQAVDYAVKARASWIWTTNGDTHGFLSFNNNVWTPVEELEPLKVLADPPVIDLEFPSDVNDDKAMERYWATLNDPQFDKDALAGYADYDRQFLVDAHKMLFGVSEQRKLPFSHEGVHILEDRGSAWHQFKNRSGSSYHTRYADFIAATSGNVVAVSLAINRRGSPGSYKFVLCVGVTRQSRKHHALQMDIAKFERSSTRSFWSVYHDGRMSSVKSTDVLEAIREAGAGAWIDQKNRIYLGRLPNATSANWRNSRELLANLIHYGIIRSNLREAISLHRKRSTRS